MQSEITNSRALVKGSTAASRFCLFDATRLLAGVRQHWQVETGLHYRRDKMLREDASRLRTGRAAQATAMINKSGDWLGVAAGAEKLAGREEILQDSPG